MPISSDILLRKFNGISDKPKMLIEIFRENNKKYRELIDKEYIKGTVLRYERTVKYLKNLKKEITLALANKWMTENPFIGMPFHLTKSNRCFLTEEELNKIIKKQFDIPRDGGDEKEVWVLKSCYLSNTSQ